MAELKSFLKKKSSLKTPLKVVKTMKTAKVVAPPLRTEEAGEQSRTAKLLDGIIFSVIFLIFLITPLFFAGLAAQGLGFEKIILFYFLVLIGAVAWVTKGVIMGELNLKRTPLDWPIAGLSLVFIISTILSVSSNDSLLGVYGSPAKGLVAFFIFILFYYLTVNNINAKKIKALFWALASSGALMAVFSLLQLFDIFILPIKFTQVNSFTPLGSLSSLSMFLVAVLPLLVVAAAQIKEIHPRINKFFSISVKVLAGASVLTCLVVLFFLKGFTFWPVAIAGMVIVLMFLLSKIIRISNNNLVIPILVFLLSVVFFILGDFTPVNLNLPSEFTLSRGASWDIAKDSLRADPVFGSGPSTFYYSFSKYKDIDFNNDQLWNVRFGNASGMLYEFLSDIGISGALLIIIITLTALSITFLTLIKTKVRELQPVLLALLASFVSILIFALLFSFNTSLILMAILISCLTISSAVIIYPDKFKTFNLSFRTSPKYALALAVIFLSASSGFVILFTTGVKTYLADVYALHSLSASSVGQRIEKLEKSKTLAPYRDVYYINLANNYLTLANQEADSGGNQAKIANSLNLAVQYGRKGVEISPNKAANQEALALIYESASFYTRGFLEMAEKTYDRLAELEPNSPVPALRIALINMTRANIEEDDAEKAFYINEAIKKYDEAISKKNNLASAYYGKAIAYERLNDIDKAIEQLGNAVVNASRSVDYRFELGRLYFNRGVIQPNLSQTATKELTEGEEAGEDGELSVRTNQAAGAKIERNKDLNTAEQLFLIILQANQNHANAQYSLALLYQKIGETGNAKIMVKELLNTLQTDKEKELIKRQFPGLY